MKNFFKGISVSQIIAGALAAVTSFLLSAKIGIAGSVIGVAVGSIVSAVASQIYQNVLKESSKKLQPDASGNDSGKESTSSGSSDDRTQVLGGEVNHGRAAASTSVHDVLGAGAFRPDGTSPSLAALASNGRKGKAEQTRTMPVSGRDKGKAGDSTKVMTPSVADKTTIMPSVDGSRNRAGRRNSIKGTGNGHSGTSSIHTFDSSRQKRNKRIAIIVAIVSALVAVGITAGIISLVTKGEGTDHVVRNMVTNSTTKDPKQQNGDPENSSTGSNGKTDGSMQGNGSTNQGNSGTIPDSGTQNGSESNGSGNSNGGGSGDTHPGTASGGTSSGSNSSSGSDSSSGNGSSGSGGNSANSGSTSGSAGGGAGTANEGSNPASGTQTGTGTPGAGSK